MGNPEPPLRRVELTIRSSDTPPAEISRVLGAEPDSSAELGEVSDSSVLKRPAREHRWELVESGDDQVDVNDLLSDMMARISPLRDGLIRLRADGCSLTLDVVQYMSADDGTGPGFSIDRETIEFCAQVGVEFDIDLYVL